MQFVTEFVLKRARLVAMMGVVFVLLAALYGSNIFSYLNTSHGLENKDSESYKVSHILKEEFDSSTGDALLLFSSTNGHTIDNETFRNEVEASLAALRNEGATTVSYYDTSDASFVSHDRKQTFVVVTFAEKDDIEKYEALKHFESEYTTDTVAVTAGGQVVAEHEISEQVENDLLRAELISLPVIGILLLLIFRSAVAVGLSLALGIFAIVGGLAVVRFLTNFTGVDQYAVNVITLLGLGLSIDYALLMISRFREELQRHEVKEAVRRTTVNAGRTIIFSGLIVMVSLLGLSVFPISFLHSVGIGGASAVLVAMAGALLILPALLRLVGTHINRWHISKKAVSDHMKSQHERWRAIGIVVLRRPIISIVIVLVVVVALALPAIQAKLTAGTDDYRELPKNTSAFVVGEALHNNFPAKESYLDVIFRRDGGVMNREGIGELYDLTSEIEHLKDVTRVEGLTATDSLSREMYQQLYEQGIIPPDARRHAEQLTAGEITRLRVYYPADVSEEATKQLIHDVRSLPVPEKTTLMVGGEAAVRYDVYATIERYAPVVAVAIVAVMVVVLSMMLRSVVIPIQAILINAFSLLATLGVLVSIFQLGHTAGLPWFTVTGSIDITVLVLVFAIAFGLSVDYTAFLYGRIREEYSKKPENDRAILSSLELTGPVITQAALLLAVVVAVFATSTIAILQQIGVGLIFVVLFDTFIMRIFLVPAVMQLLGKANWWLPGKN